MMKKLAIIGFGPRGLSALENVFLLASKIKANKKFHTTVFEIEEELGTSKVWNTKQPKINRVNISERGLQELAGRPKIEFENFTIPAFPSYSQWNSEEKLDKNKPDKFPPRRKIGKYLSERAISIVEILKSRDLLTIKNNLIADLDLNKKQITIIDLDKKEAFFDEILLTIGHQPTKIDKDIKEYEIQSIEDTRLSFAETYPIQNIINEKSISAHKNVAIRGFGLAMIDAVRALTIEKGGEFKITNKETFESEFITNKRVPSKIIPYSLDGLPIVPKPLNAKIDDGFSPSEKDLEHFKNIISNVASGKVKVKNATFLINVIAELSAAIYFKLEHRLDCKKYTNKEVEEVAIKWLKDENFSHELIQSTICNTDFLIHSFVQMACNKQPISLDYCIGQLIRHCQPTLYTTFSHADLDEEIIAAVIQFDEKMKRYSYGPPIESMQQLLALEKAKIIDFDFVNNPTIEDENNSWIFKNKNKSIPINVIINSVLSAPKLLEVSSLIIQNLLRNKMINPIHTKLGIHTKKDGLILSSDEKSILPIAVLGRLAKGSVIGVDAILECFGTRIENWAIGFVERLEK